jgi:hypothetical protein
MIDWLNVLYNLLWIVGLATLLATFSLAHWLAEQEEQPWPQLLAAPSFRLALATGFALFSLGLSLMVAPWWYKIGWIGLMGVSLWEGQRAWRAWLGRPGRS